MAPKNDSKRTTTDAATEGSAPAAPPQTHRHTPQKTARIVRMAPRDNSKREKLIARKLGGQYRVIHGEMAIPLPEEQWRKPDGGRIEGARTFSYATPGDIVEFDHYEAALYLDMDIIEPLDAKPSRVGKIWKPPATKPYPFFADAAVEPTPEASPFADGVGQ